MIAKSLLTLVGALCFLAIPHAAHAVDQLPLPDAEISPPQAEVIAFVNTTIVESSAKVCSSQLKSVNAKPDEMTPDKIRALKAYRECRANYALQQLATLQRQDLVN